MRLLTEEVAKKLSELDGWDRVELIYYRKMADEAISITLKAVGEWLMITYKQHSLLSKVEDTIEAFKRGEMPEEVK